MKIKYLINSGLLIESEQSSILIDGIIEDKNIFDSPAAAEDADIIKGSKDYRGVSALVFTHCHDDHYSWKKAEGYLMRHPSCLLMAPHEAASLSGCPLHTMDTGFFEKKSCTIGDMTIEYFRTGHVSADLVGGNDHYALIVKTSGESILVTGDFDIAKFPELKGLCKGIDTAFFNPIVLGTDHTIDQLLSMDIARIFIYHIPSQENDRYGYRLAALSNYKKQKSRLHNCSLLLKHYLYL